MSNNKTPTTEELLAGLGKELEGIGKSIGGLLVELKDQVTISNRVVNGIMSFTYRDRLFYIRLPEASSDLHQRGIALAGTFSDLHALERVEKKLKPGSVIIDAGACVGNHTIWFASQIPGAKVIAFEPMKSTFSVLSSNIELNNLTNVELRNEALGDACGCGRLRAFETDRKNIGGTCFERCHEETDYKVVTIDSLALDKLDFIKIDVEGMQLPLLQGAVNTIDKLHPSILIELFPGKQQHTADTWDEEREVNMPKRFLWEHGYELHRVSPIDWLCSPR